MSEKGFWEKVGDGVMTPFNWVADKITDSSAFPFKRMQELAAIPPKDMTKEQETEYAKLRGQNDRLVKGDGKLAPTLGVVTERAVAGTIDVAKEMGKGALNPIADEMSPPWLKFMKDHWMSIAAVVGAVALTFTTGGGFLATIATLVAIAVVVNDVVKSSTSKGIMEHMGGFFSSGKSKTAHAHGVQRSHEVAMHEPEIEMSKEPMLPTNPQPFPGEKSKWTEIASIRKDHVHS